ncbi:MAG: erythromycin esterase family protein [Myxococcales bacterium]|nr:erythromycin esterase family protein [Myxococcales bacterium]
MFVADLNTGEPVFKGKSRKPLLDIVRELPDGEYVVAGTSVDKYSVARVTVPLSQDPNLSYRTDCVSITGSVIGQPAGDHPVGFFPWTDPERIQAVGVEKDGAFAACVPSGRYYAVVEGEQFHSQKLYFDLASGAGAADVKLWALDELNRPASRSAFVNTPDLPEFIDAAAKNASVIGIGESDHGSASALTSRTKLIMSLAALGRVSAIAIEAGPVEVFPLDDYVTGKSVDVKAAVAGLGYWIWNTKEFIDFLKMIRIHNQSGSGDVIRIVGIDLPQNEKAFDYLIEHVGRLGLEDALVAQLAPLRTDRAAGAAALDAKERQSMIDELRVRASRMSGSEAERDRVALLSVAHRIEVSALTGVWRNAQRDVAMADMVLLNAERTEGKVLVVLAHNDTSRFR